MESEGRSAPDFINQAMLKLYDVRRERLHLISERYSVEEFAEVAPVFADIMNMIEQLFVVANIPSDGFVSMTPERPSGTQE